MDNTADKSKPMMVMISGPYTHGSADPAVWSRNHAYLNELALAVFRKGHVPVLGVNAFLPVIEAAGTDIYAMMPLCLHLADRCDAVLRMGGASAGADQEVAVFVAKGLPVFYSLEELPACAPGI
ncbi:hypothetical protein [Rurimicrobium arvi]|uniref:DUF4406 domain-containing protein n=1 Tax=Rurimicrobium arvi TaxID=2049916 RepID=A0ABP8N350_9BACT